MNPPIIAKDFSAKTITVEKIFFAPRALVWRAYSEADLLEKWWGPKEWPASSKSFDFSPGGHWHYSMTGPDGTRAWGWIDYIDITPEEGFIAVDAFADADGNKDTSMPSTAWTTYFEDAEDGDTQVVTTLTFPTTDAMQTILDMGFEEGFTDALDNLDTLLMTLPQE